MLSTPVINCNHKRFGVECIVCCILLVALVFAQHPACMIYSYQILCAYASELVAGKQHDCVCTSLLMLSKQQQISINLADHIYSQKARASAVEVHQDSKGLVSRVWWRVQRQGHLIPVQAINLNPAPGLQDAYYFRE